MSDMATLDWMVRGGAIALFLLTGGAMVFGSRSSALRIAGPCFMATGAAYALNSAPYAADVLGPVKILTGLMTHGAGGWLWLLAMVLFDDRRVHRASCIAPLGLLALGAAGDLTPAGRYETLWATINVASIGLALHALFQVLRRWPDDLVEMRRRLRGGFVFGLALYVLVVTGMEVVLEETYGSPWRSLTGAFALLGLGAMGASAFLSPNREAFDSIQRTATTSSLSAQDRLLLDKLARAMDKDQLWRREGLTISALAADMGVPERQVRTLINRHLGHRNFPAFVNSRRVEAAKLVLADPERVRTNIATIAFEHGFGSLAPFNRAFRSETGVTPTAWREAEFAKLLSKTDNAD